MHHNMKHPPCVRTCLLFGTSSIHTSHGSTRSASCCMLMTVNTHPNSRACTHWRRVLPHTSQCLLLEACWSCRYAVSITPMLCCPGLPEEVRITVAALAGGYIAVALSSQDRTGSRCWDTGWPPEQSRDIPKVGQSTLAVHHSIRDIAGSIASRPLLSP